MTAQKLRRQINNLIGLLIPTDMEQASQKATKQIENNQWEQEQRYSREYSLHASMVKIEWPSYRDSRHFPRKHYKLISRA